MTAETTLIRRLGARMRTPRLRTLGEFAEAEIILPDGPYQGQRFRLNRAPVARLLFNELGSDRWRRAFVTGPNQDGKTLLSWVIPAMYLLFERRETIIVGVPTLDMVKDKWRVDLLPTIQASRYKDQCPQKGSGSKQGDSVLYSFGNGAHLRFMTGGGDDQSRAGFTARNLLTTETDGFDEVGGSSREGSKFDQLCRRTLAYGDAARVIAECTVSTEQGRTWWEIQNGSASRIAIPCPHCREYVTPEREHFVGWQDAETEVAAAANAHVVCPACGAQWTNEQRVAANHKAVLAHKGQTVDPDGTVKGEAPATHTLGFRWTVVNSVLNPNRLRDVAGIEWRAKRAANEDAAERDVCQSQWALPAKPDAVDLSQLDYVKIMARTRAGCPRGFCPEGTEYVTVGCDVGKWLCHWAAPAWRPGATPHVADYGRIEVPSGDMAEETAILASLRHWRDTVVVPGWGGLKPVLVLVDARYKPDPVFKFCEESGPQFMASMGFSATQRRVGEYKRDTGSKVLGVGDGYALVQTPGGRRYIEVNSDIWKTFLHARLHAPTEQPGAMTLFASPSPGEHLSYAKHLTSEKRVEEFVPGQGTVTRWEAVSRNNHYLDCTSLACVAGHIAGARVVGTEVKPPPPKTENQIAPSDWMSRGKRW